MEQAPAKRGRDDEPKNDSTPSCSTPCSISEICGIYIIKNLVDGKRYVGQSVSIKKRWINLKAGLRYGKHKGNPYLQYAWSKHGEQAFEFRVLEECPESMLDVREIAWIAYHKSDQREFGYNLEGGGRAGRCIAEETKRKISEAKKGHPVTEETRKRIRESQTGKRVAECTRQKMSFSHKGKRFSEEHKKKIGEANKRKHLDRVV